MSTSNGQPGTGQDQHVTPQEGDNQHSADSPPGGEDTTTGQDQSSDRADTGDDAGGDAAPSSFADVMAGLDERSQRLVRAKLNEKNNESRNLRRRLNANSGSAPQGDQDGQADDGHSPGQVGQPSDRERRAAEREQKANRRMVHAEIRALAVDRFADPSDAPAFLGTVEEYLDSAGDPDSEAIRFALDDLLDRKPHLAKPTPQSATSPRPPAPNPAQGATAPVRNNGQGGVAEAERRFGKRAGTAATH